MTGATKKLRPSDIWDRFFWSFMVTIFAGLVWMKFLQETARFESVGYIVAIGVGVLWFWWGIRKLRRNGG